MKRFLNPWYYKAWVVCIETPSYSYYKICTIVCIQLYYIHEYNILKYSIKIKCCIPFSYEFNSRINLSIIIEDIINTWVSGSKQENSMYILLLITLLQ